MPTINALPFGSRLNGSAIHVHLFIGVAESFFFPSFHLFLSNPFALQPINGTVASPDTESRMAPVTTRRGALACVPRTQQVAPVTSPCRPDRFTGGRTRASERAFANPLRYPAGGWPATAPLTGHEACRVPQAVHEADGDRPYILLTVILVSIRKLECFSRWIGQRRGGCWLLAIAANHAHGDQQ
jgi:hypothetical protein